ncbi:uncharacterized protein AMSG_01406 [Thecamonas trahens ATCC 50062]|uniref:Secreted protein n=1 Tax=Thecamonas trahens ATCC 50062 TaxID=461836 RepID=A0A0L0DN62_THETB|nr:hypothetical protein AMSG_01406 [Thecamonas trahens ATCC 50062]KNC53695.1 hypothetical protein AMSG_01406 [Thecamonas trahens ATCC 50062]|eukprot:XP_013762009.1 hypothetical protein AMSG_01406 [Thecamonas trahens ATCC 50062]
MVAHLCHLPLPVLLVYVIIDIGVSVGGRGAVTVVADASSQRSVALAARMLPASSSAAEPRLPWVDTLAPGAQQADVQALVTPVTFADLAGASGGSDQFSASWLVWRRVGHGKPSRRPPDLCVAVCDAKSRIATPSQLSLLL